MIGPVSGPSASQNVRRAVSSSPWRALVLVTLASTSFASVQAAVKALGPQVGVAPPVFARGFVGVLVLGWWARRQGRSLRPRGRWRLALRCVAGGVAMLAVYAAIGLHRVELGTASMLLKTAPLWVAVMAPFALREPTRRGVWLAVAVGALGVALIYREAPLGANLGISLCLLSGFLAAVAYMALRGLAHTDDPPTVVFVFSLFLALGAAPFMLDFVVGLGGHPWQVWLAMTVAGLCGTGGQLFLTEAYRWGTAAMVTIGSLGGVAVAMLLDLAIWGEVPPRQAIVGGVLAMGAGVIAGQASRKPAEPASA
jgi:drug/metabolite transporter (DMT)-like permease